MKFTDLPIHVLDAIITYGTLDMRDVRQLRYVVPEVLPNAHAAQRTIAKAWRAFQATRELQRRVFGILGYGPALSCDDLTRLLAAGANVDTRSFSGTTPLFYLAMLWGGPDDLLHCWLDAGADVTVKSQSRSSALFFCRTAPIATRLIQAVDVNTRNDAGSTALINAASSGWCDVVHVLVAAGADVRVKDYYGRTALCIARSLRLSCTRCLEEHTRWTLPWFRKRIRSLRNSF